MYLHRITTRRVSNLFAVGVVCALTVAAAGSSIGSPMAQQTTTELTDTLTLNLALLTSSNASRLLMSPTSPIELHLPPATTSKDPAAETERLYGVHYWKGTNSRALCGDSSSAGRLAYGASVVAYRRHRKVEAR
jgi:hypothetical protein